MKKSIQDILDGDVPNDVPHWIVEFQWESDEPKLTPLDAAKRALAGLVLGRHVCTVAHVRSGLQWDVDLATDRVIEIKRVTRWKS